MQETTVRLKGATHTPAPYPVCHRSDSSPSSHTRPVSQKPSRPAYAGNSYVRKLNRRRRSSVL